MLRNMNQQEIEKNLPVICTVDWKLEESAFIGVQTTEESKKAGLKLNIQKVKIMACGPITSWQINEETVGWKKGLDRALYQKESFNQR